MSIDEIAFLRRMVREKRTNKYMASVLNCSPGMIGDMLNKHNLKRPKSKTPMQRYHFRAEASVMEGLRREADERGLSVCCLVGLVLRKHLNKKESL